MKKIGIILGTNRPNRIGLDIANWVKENMKSDIVETEIIDLKVIDLPFLDEPKIPAKGNLLMNVPKDGVS